MKFIVKTVLLSLLLLWPVVLVVNVWAAENYLQLDDVVVEAEKPVEDFRVGDVDPTQLTAFATVINLENIDPGISGLGELLAREVGVQVREVGGLGGYSTVSLRGASGDQVLVYLDGVLLNDASGGGVDLGLIPLNDLVAVEVYRGSSPVNFSRSGLGGIINLRSRRGGRKTSGSLGFGLGSFGAERLAGRLNYNAEPLSLLATAEYLSSDNDFKIINDNGTSWNEADDERQPRYNNELFRRSLTLKGDYAFTENLRLELSGQYLNQDRRLPTYNNTPLANTHLTTENQLWRARLTAEDLGPRHCNLAGQLFFGDKEEIYDDSQNIIGLGRQHECFQTRKYGASLFAELPLNYQVWSANLEVGLESYETEDLLFDRPRGDSRRRYLAFSLQDSLYFLGRRLLLTPALHYQYYSDELDSAVGLYGGTIPGYSRRHDNFSPALGLRLKIFAPLSLRANAASYNREPSFFELFGDRGLTVGNPDLKPENGENYDLGLLLELPLGNPWLRRLELEGVLFYSRIDDLISRIYDARGVGRSENIAAARISGFELRSVLDFGAGLRMLANATWQDTENRGDIMAFRGCALPGRWEKSFLVRLEHALGWFKSYIEYQAEKGMYYDAANLLPAAGKSLVNLGATLTVPLPEGELSFDLTAKNINGDQYQDFNGYPMPEQEYFCNVSYKF